jgi:hypothetical protein
MRVELLYWRECPSHPAALADLRAALSELGHDPEAVMLREVRTDGEASELAFSGSPTIRVNGDDLFPSSDAPGLFCRIYRLRDGRFSPTPDPEDLRELLAAGH